MRGIEVVDLGLVDAVVLVFVYCALILGTHVVGDIFLSLIIILAATLLHLMQTALLMQIA